MRACTLYTVCCIQYSGLLRSERKSQSLETGTTSDFLGGGPRQSRVEGKALYGIWKFPENVATFYLVYNF